MRIDGPAEEPAGGDLPVYRVELTEPAEMEVEAAYMGRLQFGQRAADRWYAGLIRAFETLARVPRGFPLAEDSDALGGEVRQFVYGKGGGAYRVLYRVIEPQGNEPGIVRISHVRHGAQRRFGTHERETNTENMDE